MSGYVSKEQSKFRIYAYGLLSLIQVVLLTMRGLRRSIRLYGSAVVPFLMWSTVSMVWTQHVDLTSKRIFLLSLVYGGIFAGICDLSYQRTLAILRFVLCGALILNFAVVLAAPDVGTHGTLWRGFMAHKNIAGMLSAFTVIVFTFDGSKLPTAARLPVVAGALTFLLFTWSKTSLITLPIALGTGAAIALISERTPRAIEITRKSFVTGPRVLFVLALISLIVLTIQRDIFLSFTNDTTTLTTRGAIWRPMIQFYLDSPLLGSGYGAYWDASDKLVDPSAINGSWKYVDQGHNGYLDLLVQVGLPGLVLALFAAFVWPLQQLTALIGREPQRAALIFATLVFWLIENFSESSLFADDSLGNGMLLIALAQLHRVHLRSSGGSGVRRRRKAGASSDVLSEK